MTKQTFIAIHRVTMSYDETLPRQIDIQKCIREQACLSMGLSDNLLEPKALFAVTPEQAEGLVVAIQENLKPQP
jgi:hypothetical protein